MTGPVAVEIAGLPGAVVSKTANQAIPTGVAGLVVFETEEQANGVRVVLANNEFEILEAGDYNLALNSAFTPADGDVTFNILKNAAPFISGIRSSFDNPSTTIGFSKKLGSLVVNDTIRVEMIATVGGMVLNFANDVTNNIDGFTMSIIKMS